MQQCPYCDSDSHDILNCNSKHAAELINKATKKAKESLEYAKSDDLFVQWINLRNRNELVILSNHKQPPYRMGTHMATYIGYCVWYYYYTLAYYHSGKLEPTDEEFVQIAFWRNIYGGIPREVAFENAVKFCSYKKEKQEITAPKLTLHKYIKYETNIEMIECPICFETIPEKDTIKYNCGHQTCEACQKILASRNTTNCACCRSNIVEIFVYDDTLKNRMKMAYSLL